MLRLNGVQVPVVLEVGDRIFELRQLAFLTGDEHIDVLRIDVAAHHLVVVQLAQCIAQVVRQAGFGLLVGVAFHRRQGRAAAGVRGMKMRTGDEVVSCDVTRDDAAILLVTDGGYGKKTPLDEYRLQGRGGIGIKAAKIDENSRGSLVSALVLADTDEILAITSAGTVMRTPAAEVRQTGRDSMGVRLVNLDEGVALVSVTQNQEDEISGK